MCKPTLEIVRGLLALGMSVVLFTSSAWAASTAEIDIEVDAALERFYNEVGGGKDFAEKAKGMLVFPNVVKAGFGIGGEYGEGALRMDGNTMEYYSTAAVSVGFQIGIQSKTVILAFMQDDALQKFRDSSGWEAGVDGSVALIKVGAGGSIDTTNIEEPIVGFVLTNKGLMYNLTLKGSKFTKLDQ